MTALDEDVLPGGRLFLHEDDGSDSSGQTGADQDEKKKQQQGFSTHGILLMLI
jgi:hypothetical protein